MTDQPTSAKTDLLYKRTIKSFARRGRGLTACQKETLKNLWPQYGIEANGILDFFSIFNRDAPHVLEIGFGNGETLVTTAKQYPQYDFIGIEVHRSGIGHVIHLAEENKLPNLRLLEGDAVEFLKLNFPDNSLNVIHIFFPDPWPKSRHHKRRLIQTEFVMLLSKKLAINGILHLATDWQDYAEHMQEVMAKAPLYSPIGTNKSEMLLERPVTKFEQRGLKLGHEVWDLIYFKDSETNKP